MEHWIESTDRWPLDYFHFGLVFVGSLVFAAAVITLSPVFAVIGGLLATWGFLYFLMED